MKQLLIFISLFLAIVCNINAQSITANQFNGRLQMTTVSNVSDSTWSITGYFTNSVNKYLPSNINVNDKFFCQIGANTYVGRISVINSRSDVTKLITFRVICNYPNPPNNIGAIIRATSNGYPVFVDGLPNALQAGIQNYFATLINSNAAGNPCEKTITKTNHQFRRGTPVKRVGGTYVRPTNDTIIPDFIVVDSLTANTFKVSTCGLYTSTLPDGLYWYTSASPGYSLTQDTVKVPLFQVLNDTMILNPIVGFNLMSGGGSGDVTSSVLADSTAAIRADFPSGGVTDGDKGDITVSSSGATWTIDNGVVTSAKVASQTLDSTDLKNRGTTLLKLAQSGATNGQVPKYNSTTGNWEAAADNNSGATTANPTGTIGLTTVNGVATSVLRSDGAPALSQSIAPTWTSRHSHRADVRMKLSTEVPYIFTQRVNTGLTGVSVPSIMPDSANHAVALDIFPKGPTPVEFAGGGYAWIDICDVDIQSSFSAPTTGLHLGVSSTAAEVGTRSWNAATTKPLKFTYGQSNTIVMSMGSNGLYMGDNTAAAAKIEFPAQSNSAGTNPIKFNASSSFLSSITRGALEWVGDEMYISDATTRYKVAKNGAVDLVLGTTSHPITNSVFTSSYAAGDLSFSKGNSNTLPTLFIRNNSGKACGLASGSTGGVFVYDDSGVFAILSESRSNINAGNIGSGAGTLRAVLGATGLWGVGVTTPTAYMHAAASTTTAASFRVPSGTAPSSPNEGDIWNNGTDLFYRTGSVSHVVAKTLKGSATLDFGSTAAGASTDLTITVTGATDGDVVSLGVPNASVTATGRYFAWVSATNTVTVRFSPTILVGSEDPASGTFKVTVTK